MFDVIPAIDHYEGRLAVSSPEGPVPTAWFGGDPVAAGIGCADAGARWVHVVDMKLALDGVISGTGVVAAIARHRPDLRIQASGGIDSSGEARAYLTAGASRVVIGSKALADRTSAERMLEALGPRAIVGIEAEGGWIRSRGADPVELDLGETLGWLSALRVSALLATALARVGSLDGPDVDLVREVAGSGTPVIAAGGLASTADLAAVHEAGAVGAVVGRAALEGSLDLRQALEWASDR